MAKELKCHELGVDMKECKYSAEGETDEEVLKNMETHLKEGHNLDWSKIAEMDYLKKHIQDVP